MRSVCHRLFVLGQLFLWLSLVNAQTDSTIINPDASVTTEPGVRDTLIANNQKPVDTTFHLSKSPLLAMGLSAAVPGLGQIYNENYWKPPIIWAVGGYWIYQWLDLNKNYKDFRNKNSQNPSDQYVRLRDFYHDERDKFAWFLGVLYVLNIVDAYAGAHLYDFDVSPELTLNGRIVPRVTASVRFPF